MNRNRIFRFSLVVLLVLATLFAAGVLVMRSRAFHRYVLAAIIEYAQQATGGRVEIGDFAFRFWGLRADLHRVVVRGTEADSQKPLFRADRLGVGLNLRIGLEAKDRCAGNRHRSPCGPSLG